MIINNIAELKKINFKNLDDKELIIKNVKLKSLNLYDLYLQKIILYNCMIESIKLKADSIVIKYGDFNESYLNGNYIDLDFNSFNKLIINGDIKNLISINISKNEINNLELPKYIKKLIIDSCTLPNIKQTLVYAQNKISIKNSYLFSINFIKPSLGISNEIELDDDCILKDNIIFNNTKVKTKKSIKYKNPSNNNLLKDPFNYLENNIEIEDYDILLINDIFYKFTKELYYKNKDEITKFINNTEIDKFLKRYKLEESFLDLLVQFNLVQDRNNFDKSFLELLDEDEQYKFIHKRPDYLDFFNIILMKDLVI